jgi:hypothetical protein
MKEDKLVCKFPSDKLTFDKKAIEINRTVIKINIPKIKSKDNKSPFILISQIFENSYKVLCCHLMNLRITGLH